MYPGRTLLPVLVLYMYPGRSSYTCYPGTVIEYRGPGYIYLVLGQLRDNILPVLVLYMYRYPGRSSYTCYPGTVTEYRGPGYIYLVPGQLWGSFSHTENTRVPRAKPLPLLITLIVILMPVIVVFLRAVPGYPGYARVLLYPASVQIPQHFLKLRNWKQEMCYAYSSRNSYQGG
eukprot:240670-Rhodomonas_salina.2